MTENRKRESCLLVKDWEQVAVERGVTSSTSQIPCTVTLGRGFGVKCSGPGVSRGVLPKLNEATEHTRRKDLNRRTPTPDVGEGYTTGDLDSSSVPQELPSPVLNMFI